MVIYMVGKKIVSFDIWNTLLDLGMFYNILADKLGETTSSPPNTYREKIWSIYRSAVNARLKGLFRRPVYDSAVFFAEKLGISVDELFKAVVALIYDNKVDKLLYSDVLETLKSLREQGFGIALLGNVMFWPGMVTRAILYRVNVLNYIDISLFSDEILLSKPDREYFLFLAEKAGVDIKDIVHVGDSIINDFTGALQAGAKAVLLKRDLDIDYIVLDEKSYIIRSLKNLLDITRYF